MNLLRVFLAPIIAVGMVSTAPASDFHDLIEFVSTSSVV
jgi:hypothetical protein